MLERATDPWTHDQRQRYAFLREAVRGLHLGRPCRLLDVGGAAPHRGGSLGWLPAALIFDGAECRPFVLDRPAFSAPGYIRGDGCTLPFRDGAFHVVSAMDVLEHVPGRARPGFLREMLRVASSLVLVSGPRRDESVAAAERRIADEIERRYHVRHVQLAEHAEHGLISDAETRAVLEAAGASTASVGFGALASWTTAQEMGVPYLLRRKTPHVMTKLDAYLDSADAEPEFEPPFYRMFWLASMTRSREDLDDLAGMIRAKLVAAYRSAAEDRDKRFREFAAAAAEMEAGAFVSALVVARGDAGALRRCLDYLLTQKVDFDLEVAVWSPGGSLAAAAGAARERPGVRLIEAESLEQAAALLRGDAILLVDEVAALSPDVAAGLQARRTESPEPGVWAWRVPWKRYFTWSRAGRRWSKFAAGRIPALRKGPLILANPRGGWVYGRCLLITRGALAERETCGRGLSARNVFLWA